MATIHEVAQRAGVSTGTVSRYLNGHRLKEKNARRVQAAIDELGYTENYLAKSLRSNQTYSIGILINNMQNTFASSVVAKIESEMEIHDYMLLMCGFRNDPELYRKKLKMFLDRHVDGLIIFEGKQDWHGTELLDDIQVPAIAINAPYSHPKVDSIVTDDMVATQRVVSDMIEKGHERIGIIAAQQDEHAARERIAGVRMAFGMARLPKENAVIYYGDYSRKSGYEGMRYLLEKEHVDAVFVCNYGMSQGALQAVYELERRIGEDLSYACFDYSSTSAVFHPRLTCICPNTDRIGTVASYQMLNAIESKELSQGISIPVPNTIHWHSSVVDLRK